MWCSTQPVKGNAGHLGCEQDALVARVGLDEAKTLNIIPSILTKKNMLE